MGKEILNEIIYIKSKYIKHSAKDREETCIDNEELHKEIDNVIIKFIEELGYKEIAEQYKEAQYHFWYS